MGVDQYGLAILIGLLIVLPSLGAQLGVDLSIVSQFLAISTGMIIKTILFACALSQARLGMAVALARPEMGNAAVVVDEVIAGRGQRRLRRLPRHRGRRDCAGRQFRLDDFR